jgi:hypothetical protein
MTAVRTNWPVISVPGHCDLPGERHRRDYAEKAAVKVRGKRANIRRVK